MQDKNWTDSKNLIDSSDRILVAKFVDSSLENVQLVDSATGVIAGDTDVLYRQFEVVESLKGTSDPSDLLWVAFEPGPTGELVDGRSGVREFTEAETYLLFLKGRLRPLEYPQEFGAVLWSGNGEPAFAELVGEQLIFRSERAYLDLLERDGRDLAEADSASPFSLTFTDLKQATD